MNEKRKVLLTKDGNIQFSMDDEERQLLKMLYSSPGWKVYRKTLLDMKQSYLEQAMPLLDGMKIKEVVSIAAGLNLAVNQLDVLIRSIDNAKPVAGEAQT